MSKYEANWSTGVLVTAEGGIGFPLEMDWEDEQSADVSTQESDDGGSRSRRLIHLPWVNTASRNN